MLAAMAILMVSLSAQSPRSLTVIAYGDTRFTDPSNVTATNPRARAALIARITEERPDAILVSGDLPWHGGVADDYAQFRAETKPWRTHGFRVAVQILILIGEDARGVVRDAEAQRQRTAIVGGADVPRMLADAHVGSMESA
jgi:hypothetical protein